MKRYTPDDLKAVLDAHKMWILDQKGGSRADLRGADLRGADLRGADLRRADLRRADLSWADLSWADLLGADLSWADLSWADLSWADLRGADLRRADLRRADLRRADLRRADLGGADLKIHSLEVFADLYNYQCWAFVTDAGVPWVRMGCLWHTLAEWDQIGIRASNANEFPDDGSEKCERRVRAFEFARAAALAQVEKFRAENPTQATT
jgi:uncharacterized protein YjbI with pentapeptide repeats